jgi:hypothetical protein
MMAEVVEVSIGRTIDTSTDCAPAKTPEGNLSPCRRFTAAPIAASAQA